MTAEKLALAHPYVKSAALFTHAGELAIAVVPELYSSAVEIRDHLWREMAGDAPTLVILVAELPVGADGAVRQDLLSRRVGTLEPGELSRYAEPAGEVERALQRIVAEAVGVERVGVLDDLIDLGGDSLAVVRVSALISERLGAEIPLEAVFEASTVRGIARLVEREQP